MTAPSPPAGYTVTSGTWGTDIDRTESTAEQGPYALEFLNTTPAADPEILGPFFPIMAPQTFERRFEARVNVKASSTAGANQVYVYLDLFDNTRTLVSSVQVMAAPVTQTTGFEQHSATFNPGTTVRWGQFRASKDNTAFSAYIDEVKCQRLSPFFIGTLTPSPTTVTTGASWTTLDIANPGTKNDFVTGLAGQMLPAKHIAPLEAGLYAFSAWVETEAASDGTLVEAAVTPRFLGGGGVPAAYSSAVASGAGKLVRCSVSGIYEVLAVSGDPTVASGGTASFDSFTLDVRHDEGADLDFEDAKLVIHKVFR